MSGDSRPRLAVVLVFLTLTVAVVGYHIYRDSGALRIEGIAQEAMRIFTEGKNARPGSAPSADPSGIEERVKAWLGASVTFPRDEKSFSYLGITREKIGGRPAAAIRFSGSDDRYLLLLRVHGKAGRGVEDSSPLFSGSSFLSWEKEGISFVFWERNGVEYLLVSDADLTRAFDLVRQHFT